MIRGTRFAPYGDLPAEAFCIPGVRRFKNSGRVVVPWHALHLVRELAPNMGYRTLVPEGPACLVPPGEDPFVAHPRTSDEAKEKATPYQREDLRFFLDQWGGIADWPCVSGAAEVVVNRGGKGFRICLADLVHRFNGGTPCRGRRWDLSIPTMVQCVDAQGTCVSRQILAAVPKGTRPTLRLTTESGEALEATEDHVFLTPNGDRMLRDLRVGDEVLVRREPVKQARGKIREGTRKHYEVVPAIPAHPYASTWWRYRKNRPGPYLESRVPKHRVVFEAVHFNNLPVEEYVRRLKAKDLDGLRFVNPATHDVHHIDGDTRNNDPDNLELFSLVEHGVQHAEDGGWRRVLPRVVPSKIVSIELVGEQPVFDLTVDEFPNFVANGIAVHNCGAGKTLLGLTFASAWKDARALVVTRSVVTGQWVREAARWLDPSVTAFAVRSHTVEVVERKLEKRVRLGDREIMRKAVLKGQAPLTLLYVLHEQRWTLWKELTEEERAALGRKAPRAAVEIEVPTEKGIDAGAGFISGDDLDGFPPVDIVAIGWETLTANLLNIEQWGPAVIVFDELHRAKDHKRFSRVMKSDGSEEVLRRKNTASATAQLIASRAPCVIGLTATPQYNLPKDWWGQLDLIEPFGFGTFREFGERYCDGREEKHGGGGFSFQAKGASNVPELKSRMGLLIRTRTKAETHKHLPPLIRNMIWVSLKEAGHVDPEVFASMRGVSGLAFQVAVASAQLRKRIIDHVVACLEEGVKMATLSMLRIGALGIYETVKKRTEGIPGLLLLHGDGSTDLEDRRASVDRLVAHDGPGALFGTMASFGESIDGLQHLDRAAFDAVPLTPGELIQLEGRFSRLGGEKSIILDYFLLHGTIHDRLAHILLEKMDLLTVMRDDAEVQTLTDVLSGANRRQETLAEVAKMLEEWELEREVEDEDLEDS